MIVCIKKKGVIHEMRLYHGSKTGIQGAIRCNSSRNECDFGKGFYTGDKEEQPMGLIAKWSQHQFYELECNLDNLNVREFGSTYMEQIDWALYIGFNRRPDAYLKYEKLCDRYRCYNSGYDVIIGPIADDKMFKLLDEFFAMKLCDKALLQGLTQVKLGNQYVFKTEKSCDKNHIQIISERKLKQDEIRYATAANNNRSMQTEDILRQLNARYRRAQDVKFFDEILEEWNVSDR